MYTSFKPSFCRILEFPLSEASPNLLPIQYSTWNYLSLVRTMLLSLKSEECPLASSQKPSVALSNTLPVDLQPQLPAGSAHTLCNFELFSNPSPTGDPPLGFLECAVWWVSGLSAHRAERELVTGDFVCVTCCIVPLLMPWAYQPLEQWSIGPKTLAFS